VFEREMPNAATGPLFEPSRPPQIAMNFGYAELTPDGHHFNTSILTDKSGKIVASTAKVHLPSFGVRYGARFSIWRSATSSRAISVSMFGVPSRHLRQWPSATIALPETYR